MDGEQLKFDFEEKVEKEYIDIELDLDDQTIRYLEEIAKKNNMTINDVVNAILQEYIEGKEKEKNASTKD